MLSDLSFNLKHTDKGYKLSDDGEVIDYILEEIIDKNNPDPPFILSYNMYQLGEAFYNNEKFITIDLCNKLKILFISYNNKKGGYILIVDTEEDKIIGFIKYLKNEMKITVLKYNRVNL